MATAAQQLKTALSNGYSGPTVQKGNNQYTPYGALLRTDGFKYPTGAKISPNGMYYDNGNGWQFAKEGVAFDDGKVVGSAKTSVTGLAPGSPVPGFERVNKSKSTNTVAPVAEEPATVPDTVTPTPDNELALFWRKLLSY